MRYLNPDKDAGLLAKQIAAILRSAHWQVTELREISEEELRGVVGLAIKVRDPHSRDPRLNPPWVKSLCEAFGQIGHKMTIGMHDDATPVIYVGPMPQ